MCVCVLVGWPWVFWLWTYLQGIQRHSCGWRNSCMVCGCWAKLFNGIHKTLMGLSPTHTCTHYIPSGSSTWNVSFVQIIQFSLCPASVPLTAGIVVSHLFIWRLKKILLNEDWISTLSYLSLVSEGWLRSWKAVCWLADPWTMETRSQRLKKKKPLMTTNSCCSCCICDVKTYSTR